MNREPYRPVGMFATLETVPPLNRIRRDPGDTRRRLLQAAFEEIYRHGFQATGLDSILARARVTKGALYHHFGSKSALGCAMIDEVVRGWIRRQWIGPLSETRDPLTTLVELARWGERRATAERLTLGCPLNNLIQEMAPLDEAMRRRLLSVLDDWRSGLAAALERGQGHGVVDTAVNPEETADFVIAAWQGSVSLAKGTGDRKALAACRAGLERYLHTLRPAAMQ